MAIREARTAVTRAGAAIEEIGDDYVMVTATPGEVRRIERRDYDVEELVTALDFPPQDSAYHNYQEMSAKIQQVASANPSIVNRFSIGKSHENHNLWAVKISDNVTTDEGEPEVLFAGLHHAREHLTVEMALHTMNLFVGNYGKTDPLGTRVTNLVNSREIYIVFNLNPDGGEYDVLQDRYHTWRKNRQPNARSRYVGTDLNCNYDYKWRCCRGSSGSKSSDTYRGSSAFSAPETRALRNFVNGRVIGGKQQIKTSITFHTYSELILWPYPHLRRRPERHEPGRPRRLRRDGPGDGRHKRLQATTSQRSVHHRRRLHRLGLRGSQDIRLHLRTLPQGLEPRLLPAG